MVNCIEQLALMFSAWYTSQKVYGLRTFTKFYTIRFYTEHIFLNLGISVLIFYFCQEIFSLTPLYGGRARRRSHPVCVLAAMAA